MSVFQRFFGDANQRTLKELTPLLDDINARKADIQAWPDARFASRMAEIRTEVKGDEKALNAFLPEVFAMVREASRRSIGLEHFDVQLLGGMVLHNGAIAEMKTGEGKTLVATSPVALNALTGLGVHVVTVNDYLARRDAGWMAKVYHFLGLTTGVIIHEQAFQYDPTFTSEEVLDDRTIHLRPVERKVAYQCDIVYGTNNEFGFDYLRDNMVPDQQYLVQRPFSYALVDEVDSILIDEARTPLIISGPAEQSTEQYRQFADLVARLDASGDYVIDEKMRTATLTETGVTKIEQWLHVENLYTAGGIELVHHLEQALKARTLFTKDKDYVTKDGEIVIVDEFTGRLMFGRRYSEGLHQAIEAKEGLTVKQENITLATITLQNLFRLYPKLSGMTGTAATEAEEFHKIYNVDVVVIPTNRDMVRKDLSDSVYKTEQGKFLAVVREIKRRYESGQPVLVGTISIERNELLSELLQKEGVPHEVLNAKNHEREAQIIAQAGRPGSVTLATNIAGRGVDIVLGGTPADPVEAEKAKAAGGLHVLGTERHESRRIDNQLRGRSGRQGDPGSTQFFLSMEDDLMRIFMPERMKALMDRMGVPEDMPLESGIVTRSIEQAQKKVEGHNFDIRKHLVEYDDVINKHRDVLYRRRREILTGTTEDVMTRLKDIVEKEIVQIVSFHTAAESTKDWDVEAMYNAVNAMCVLQLTDRLAVEELREGNDPMGQAGIRTKIVEHFTQLVFKRLDEVVAEAPEGVTFADVARNVMLRTIDQLWVEHLDLIDRLREGIGLRGYAQRDPLVEYKREAFDLFAQLMNSITTNTAHTIFKVTITPAAGTLTAPVKPIQLSSAQSVAQEARTAVPFKTDHHIINGIDVSTVGRNDECPCGSGKKFKKCYLANDPNCKLRQG